MWPDRRLIELFKTEFPIVQAPMAGVQDAELVIAAAQNHSAHRRHIAIIPAPRQRHVPVGGN